MTQRNAGASRLRGTRHRLVALAVGVTIVLGVLAGVRAISQSRALPSPPDTTYAGLSLPLGAPQSVGVILPNPKGETISVTSVDVGASHNLEVLGVLGVVPPRQGPYQSTVGPGFPPHPAAWNLAFREVPATFEGRDFPSEPGRRHLEIVLGVRTLQSGHGALNGITVNYEIDGRRQKRVFAVAFVLCVAPRDCADIPDTSRLLKDLGVVSNA